MMSLSAIPGSFRSFVMAWFMAAALLVSGCVYNAAEISHSSLPLTAMEKEGRQEQVPAVLEEIEQRNLTLEDNPNWLSQAYRKFFIKELSDIDENSYTEYRRYLGDGALYIIVHPAYNPFFDNSSLFEPLEGDIRLNVVDRFLLDRAFSSRTRLMQAQERMLRDFLEYASTAKKLVLLVIPGDYAAVSSDLYSGDWRDEYMRYINEITNESGSVLYLFSRRSNSGGLGSADRKRLQKFLSAVSPQQVLVGGGYMGRCVDDFSSDLQSIYRDDRLYLVPEITAWSPLDITSDEASSWLHSDGTIDVAQLTDAALRKNRKVNKANLQIRNFSNEVK